MGLDLQPDRLTAGLAGHCQPDKKILTPRDCCIQIRLQYLSKYGVWTGCGQWQCATSRQQVACGETEEPMIPLSFPSHSLSRFSLQIGKVSAACSCCRLHLHWTVDWTGAATPVAPKGLEGSTPWCTCYKVAKSKQGITASSSLMCSNTAIAELSKGSNTPPTNSTNLRLTMQHKSGTAQIWHDKISIVS